DPLPGQQIDHLCLAGDGVVLEEAGDPVLALRLGQSHDAASLTSPPPAASRGARAGRGGGSRPAARRGSAVLRGPTPILLLPGGQAGSAETPRPARPRPSGRRQR